MKNKLREYCLYAVLASVLVAFVPNAGRAQYLTIYPFDTEAELTNDLCGSRIWGWWSCAQSWVLSWTPGPTNQWDPTMDSDGKPTSGSLRQYYWFPTGTGWHQRFNFVNLVTTPGPNQGPINFFRDYGYCALDVRIDPSSPVNTAGNYGEYMLLAISVRTNADLSTAEDWDDVFRLNPSPADAGRWVTYKGTPTARQTNVCAFFTGLQGTDYTTAESPIILNVDNLRMYTPPAVPATNLVIYPFDTEDELTNDLCGLRIWGWWSCAQSWVLSWTPGPTNQWDFAQDANKAPGSGSLRQYYWFPTGTGWHQRFNFVNLVSTPGAKNYGPLNFFRDFGFGALDVKIDPSSPVNAAGNYGEYMLLAISVRTNADLSTAEDWDDIFRLNPSPAAAGQWVTYQGAPTARQTNVCAFFTGLQGTDYTVAESPIIFNVDNLRFFSPAAESPRLDIERASGGLEFNPAPTPARNNPATFIMHVANAFDSPALAWMSYPDSNTGQPTPVTYALHVNQFPSAANSGFVAHMILAPHTTPEGWRAHPELDLPNVIYVTITNNADGTATGNFRYKINAPNANVWEDLGSVSSPTAVGMWSLICYYTNVSLRAPNGATVNATITEEAVGLISDPYTPLRVWLGVQPRNGNNWNQRAVFTNFRVSYVDSGMGEVEVLNDTWTVDFPTRWVQATDCVGILSRPTNTVYRLSWPAPSTGFSLQQSSSLAGPWTLPGFPVGTCNDRRVSFVPAHALPSAQSGYFRLYKP